MAKLIINGKQYEVVWVRRKDLYGILDRETRDPEYIFAAWVRTRVARQNEDGTIRPAGTIRRIICKTKPNIQPTQDWESAGKALGFDPHAKDLYHVYTTEGPDGDDGTGNHWAFINLRTCFLIVNKGFAILVKDCEDSRMIYRLFKGLEEDRKKAVQPKLAFAGA